MARRTLRPVSIPGSASGRPRGRLVGAGPAASLIVLSLLIVTACSSDDDADDADGVTPTDLDGPVESGSAPDQSDATIVIGSDVVSTSLLDTAGSAPAESAGDDAAPGSVTATPPTSPSTSVVATSGAATTTTTIDPLDVSHVAPVDPTVDFSFTLEAHASYRASDLFATAGCGTTLVSPVSGTVDEVLTDVYDPGVDDPATRGGNAVSIIGDDGVRYYLAHFQQIDPAIAPGARATAGQTLGSMGDTGRAGACHVHFGLSLDCPDGAVDDWFIRRGVIWPNQYVAAWRDGVNLSPLAELQQWFAEYPDACAGVENTPYPVG